MTLPLATRCSRTAAQIALDFDFEPGKLSSAMLLSLIRQAVLAGADLGLEFAKEVVLWKSAKERKLTESK